MEKLLPDLPKLNPITEKPIEYSLKGAEDIRNAAEEKMAMESVDKLEWDLFQAFLALADRVGRHRASEVVSKYFP